MGMGDFLTGFNQQMLGPTGSIGSELADIDNRKKNKLELAMLSKKIELENQAKMQMAQQEQMLKSIPQDQFSSSVDYLQSKPGASLGGVTHPAAQAAVLGGVKPLFGIAAKSKASILSKANNDDELVKAILNDPEAFDTIPPAVKARVLPALQAQGFNYLGKPLGPELFRTSENAKSGLRRVADIESLLQGDDTALAQLAVPGSPTQRRLKTAMAEVEDVITRLRTGAALNKDEQEFYSGQLPGILDALSDYRNPNSASAVKYKLSLFKELFQGLSQKQATATVGNKQAAPPKSAGLDLGTPEDFANFK
jgi:hypothetical protein